MKKFIAVLLIVLCPSLSFAQANRINSFPSLTIGELETTGVLSGLVMTQAFKSGVSYVVGPPGSFNTATNTTPITSNVLYVAKALAPSQFIAASLFTKPSSSNASVGAKFKTCIYAPNATTGLPDALLGSGSEVSVGDSDTTSTLTSTLSPAVVIPQGVYYAGLLATTSTTGARFYLHGSGVQWGWYAGGSTANILANGPIVGYSVSATYASGCPNPFGTPTALAGVGTLPFMGVTVQ